MALPDDPELRRFARWARRVRFVGRFLSRTSLSPDELPDCKGRPVVMVANHRSLADVFIAVDALDRFGARARCLVRENYVSAPVAGWWLRTMGCIGAGDGSGDAVDEAVATLARGRPVAVMAEGRITPPDQRDESGLGPFRSGFVSIARQAGAVIMPIAIVGADEIWGSRSRLPRVPWRGRPDVSVSIAPTIVIDDMTDDEAVDATRTAIAEMIAAA